MSNEDFHKILLGAVNKKVLQVNAGGFTGSIFSIDIGDKLIKEEKGGQIFYEGGWILMVYCSWRLFDNVAQKPITSSNESSDLNGIMTLELNRLLDDVIENILLSSFRDLVIVFKSGKVLSVFCDLTPQVDAETNWLFRAQGKYFSVNNSFEIVSG
jgi:hypothetical protein